MKISRFKIGILLIFIIVLIHTVVYARDLLHKNDIKKLEIIVQNEDVELDGEEKIALDLVNQYRNENGLHSLKPISELQDVAKLKAEDLALDYYFAHTSPTLGTPFEMLNDNGIKYRLAGENLAGNTTPERAVNAWINSPSHRDNILEKGFQYTGIYVIDDDIYGKIFVQLFIGM